MTDHLIANTAFRPGDIPAVVSGSSEVNVYLTEPVVVTGDPIQTEITPN